MTSSKRRTLSVVMAIMMMFTLILPGVGTVRAQGLDKDNLQDGTYEIGVELYHATNDAPSMARDVIQDVAEIVVEDGIYTMYIYTQTALIFGIPANLQSMEVFDENGDSVEVTVEELDTEGNPASLSFVMPHTEEFISVSVDSGMSISPARLKLDWSSLTKVSEVEGEEPEAEVEVPEVEGETPETEVEAPEVEGETPEIDVEAPEVETETPETEVEVPEVETETPEVGTETPEIGTETPEIETETPETEVEAPGTPELDINNLADGTYEIDVALWHATNNQPSMACGVIQDVAEIVVENGVYSMIVYTQAAEIMGVPANLESMEVFDNSGNSVAVTRGEINADGYPASFVFAMPHTEEFISVSVTSAAPTSMTNEARLKLDWSSLVKTSEEVQEIPTGGPVENNGNNGNNGSNENGGSNESNVNNGSVLDRENLEDGIYEVEVALWHATNDTESMANGSLKSIARIVVEDGDYTMLTYTQPMTLGTITASLQSKRVENSSGGFSNATVETTDMEGNPTSFSFEMPHTERFINAQVNPMVAIMGNDYIDARINVNWSTLEQVSDTTDLGTAPSNATVSTSANGSSEISTLPGQTPTAPGLSSPGSVQTGDDMNLFFYTMALLFSGLVIGYYIWKNKFRKAVRVDD